MPAILKTVRVFISSTFRDMQAERNSPVLHADFGTGSARRRPEDISFRHVTEPLQPEMVLETLGKVFQVEKGEFRQRRRNSYLRAVAARFLIRYAVRSERDIAVILGMGSGSAVSKQLGNLEAKIMADRNIIRRIKKAEEQLDKKHVAAIVKS